MIATRLHPRATLFFTHHHTLIGSRDARSLNANGLILPPEKLLMLNVEIGSQLVIGPGKEFSANFLSSPSNREFIVNRLITVNNTFWRNMQTTLEENGYRRYARDVVKRYQARLTEIGEGRLKYARGFER